MILTAIAFSIVAQASSCLPVRGDVIRAVELAEVLPAFADAPSGAEIGYAPVPGATRVFTPADIEREARRLNIELSEPDEVCFAWPLSLPAEERLLKAMDESLGVPGARVEIAATSSQPAPEGTIVFPRSGLQPPPDAASENPVLWKGYIEYATNRRFMIWARVRIHAAVTRVVTTAPVRAGEPIGADQVRLEHFEGFPFGDPSAQTLEQVVGQILRRPLTAGMAVPEHFLDRPWDVERKDLVKVHVRNGSAVITAEGLAESRGRAGDLIPIRNPKSGTTFKARITGPKEVALTLSGK